MIMWFNQQATWWRNALQLPLWKDAMESIYTENLFQRYVFWGDTVGTLQEWDN